MDLAKIQRQLQEAQKAMAAAGIDLQIDTSIDIEAADEIIAQAEGVIAFLDNPKAFCRRARSCSWCERTFIPLPPSVGYCSNDCRKKSLAEKGLAWDPSKGPRDRWGNLGIPLVVPPEVVELLMSRQVEPVAVAQV